MFTCELQYNETTKTIPLEKMTFFEELYVDAKTSPIPITSGIQSGKRFQITIHPKEDVTIQNLEIQYTRSFQHQERIFCNGYQSWSESREFDLQESIPSLRSIARPLMGNYGDYHIPYIRRGKGQFHSWTYSYIRQSKGITLIGSLGEQSAFTLIQMDTVAGQIRIQKELAGLEVKHSYPALDIVVLEGAEQAVFDAYFDLMGIEKPTLKPAIGWTSWYHYYTDITEDIILQNLTAFQEKNTADAEQIDTIFQIDDGYQSKVGDWLRIQSSFPNGMRPLARKIQAAGYLAGLWLAPFICEKTSELAQRNPDWLLQDAQGNHVKAGYNPTWSGHFYVLDFYHPKVQEYLTGVFHTVLHKWGFDLVKLDFLYAVCIIPRPQKTRGQIMSDAMQFLRNIVGKKRILACGVPLGSCFGLVDYCRIGADIHLRWEHRLLAFLRNRERVSTRIALRSVLGRWQLNQRAFINDPDVFILRQDKNHLSPTQQDTILTINALLGKLFFTSDFLADYTPEQTSEFQGILDWQAIHVQKVVYIKADCYQIYFKNNSNNYVACCNLTSKKQAFSIEKMVVELNGFESLVVSLAQ